MIELGFVLVFASYIGACVFYMFWSDKPKKKGS